MSSDGFLPHDGSGSNPRPPAPACRREPRIELSDPLRAMLGEYGKAAVNKHDPMVQDRIRTLVSFARGADLQQRQRRVDRFSQAEPLSMAIHALACADELLSAALAGDLNLFRHKLNVLMLTCAGDLDLHRAAGWRLRRLAVSPFFELHMEGCGARRQLRRSLSQAIQLLERGRIDE